MLSDDMEAKKTEFVVHLPDPAAAARNEAGSHVDTIFHDIQVQHTLEVGIHPWNNYLASTNAQRVHSPVKRSRRR